MEARIVNGASNYIAVTNGKIYSIRSSKFLKPRKVGKGYKSVTLRINGKSEDFRIHRIIALTFLDNPENKRTVNHIDGNKANNHVDNLEWATHKENERHKLKYLSGNHAKGGNHVKARAVSMLDMDGKVLKNFECIMDAARYLNICSGASNSILQCCKKTKGFLTCCGYKWKFNN